MKMIFPNMPFTFKIISIHNLFLGMYAKEYDSSKKQVKCLNSHGSENSEPSLDVDSDLKIFRVKCTGSERSERRKQNSARPQTGPQMHQLQCLENNAGRNER